MANNQQLLLGEGAGSAPAVYIEDVFSTYLYTGNGSTQTITNNIDLSTKGGLVWSKDRSGTNSHRLYDTVRGGNKSLSTNQTAAQDTWSAPYIMTFNSNGYETGLLNNESSFNYASWTFRKQPKFFDIVTYTGDGTNNRAIAHNLGSAPGMIIVKNVTAAQSWIVYHRSTGTGNFTILNSTGAVSANADAFPSVSSTTFVPTANEAAFSLNTNATTFVAYLFAHDAGGFGLAGTDNVISCGSFTTVSNGKMSAAVNLGYEPQWLLVKRSVSAENWTIYDTMRGLDYSGYKVLYPNLSNAEYSSTTPLVPTATGFDTPTANGPFANSTTYIYIAIRRGPMKVPTVGTSVFDPEAYTGTSATRTITSGFPVDLSISKIRSQNYPGGWFDRLRGALQVIRSSTTDPEVSSADSLTGFDSNTGVILGSDPSGRINRSPETYAMWNFQRAPGFFDVVVATGNSTDTSNWPHNLQVAPELIIRKSRTNAYSWSVWCGAVTGTGVGRGVLNTTAAWASGSGAFTYNGTNTNMTSSYFSTSSSADVNSSADSFVTYLFATLAGVSKVGSYTGNGSSQTIACGFAAGSRFVMIKRTDSTGDWYVWDSARGIVAGNDPHLSLNDTAAEVTTDDSVDTDNSGFIVNQLSATNVNVTSATYIFLAIA